MDRRGFIVGAAVQAAALAAGPALANVPSAYDWSASPPRQSREAFVEWMVKNRGEDPRFWANASTGSVNSSPTTTCGTRRICAPIS